MFKKLVVSLFLMLLGNVSFAVVSPDIDRDQNGVPLSAIHGKSGGSWVAVKVSTDGTIATSGGSSFTLTPGTTIYATESQIGLLQRTTVHLDAPITISDVDVTGSTVSVNDTRYINKTSSGTSGLITSATSATITVTDNVDSWSFIYKDSLQGRFINIQPSIYGTNVPLEGGDVYDKVLSIPAAVTFSVTGLIISTTLQYEITTIK